MIRSYFDATVTIVTLNKDKRGIPTTESTVNVNAKLVWETVTVKDRLGRETVSRGYIDIISRTISHENYIRINNIDYVILNIEEKKDFSVRFIRVYLE